MKQPLPVCRVQQDAVDPVDAVEAEGVHTTSGLDAMGRQRLQQTWRWPLFLVAVLACSLLAACKSGTSVGARPAQPNAASPSATSAQTPATAPGQAPAAGMPQNGGACALNQTVRNPEPDTPEWLIAQAYLLAQQPDTDANFQAFVQLFPAGKDPRQIKEFYWSHLRKNVGKYVLTPGSGDFVICRTVAHSDGTQYYIRPSGSSHPPPLRVGKVDGAWKFTFFTPF